MRKTALLVALLTLLASATVASAQERTLTYTTTVTPDTLVFETKFKEDENGERMRDESGAFVLERQFVTVTVRATYNCPVAPQEGHQFAVFAAGPAFTLRDPETREVTGTHLELSPRHHAIPWVQESVGGEWVAEDTFEVDVISDTKPAKTLEGDYTWNVDGDDTSWNQEACPIDSQTPSAQQHTVVIPGFDIDSEPGDNDPDGGDGKETPAPGFVLVLAALGLALMTRRS